MIQPGCIRWSFVLFIFCVNFSMQAKAKSKIDETWGSHLRSETRAFTDIESLKRSKKMGIQTTLSGATGLLGVNLNLNFTSDIEFSLGVGVSRGFRSFNAHIKRSLGGNSFSPYFVGGYSRWYSGVSGDELEHSSPAVLANKFLTARERQTGKFAENIIYPGLGLQYLQLSGELQGVGLFAELLMLVDLDDFITGPTAGLGANYYF